MIGLPAPLPVHPAAGARREAPKERRTIRRRMASVKTVMLLIGLAVLGYILKDTFAPLPAAPLDRDALAAGITLVAGIVLPLAYPPVRRAIANSPLLKAGASALLGTRPGK